PGRPGHKQAVEGRVDFGDWDVPKSFTRSKTHLIIYFDKESKIKLIDRYADNLKVGGYLFIGHSESLFKLTDRFELIGQTIYRKVK
ncbi:MAG: chemotaxis protein CheR, partial [gamma proteobacterium endosymbiont of Lamellibrachia anaximandri]|nr:chemotaxis protein CheR [gamma proteobacterium endosymbiont of Lamellibrachia anaximandri]